MLYYNIRKFVQYTVIFITVLLIIVDIYFYFKGYTISEDMKEIAELELVFLPWLWGVLAGHLFLAKSSKQVVLNEKVAVLTIVVMSGLLYMVSTYIPEGTRISGYPKMILMISGVVLGYFLWPQNINAQNTAPSLLS